MRRAGEKSVHMLGGGLERLRMAFDVISQIERLLPLPLCELTNMPLSLGAHVW